MVSTWGRRVYWTHTIIETICEMQSRHNHPHHSKECALFRDTVAIVYFIAIINDRHNWMNSRECVGV